MLIAMLLAAPQLMAPAVLQARVEAFAGRPAIVDARLLLPDCAEPILDWANDRSVAVRCAAPAWQVFVPVAAGRAAAVIATSVIRRGDRVVVEAGGTGFVVGLETVAEADSRDGRVTLRAPGSNRRLTGTIDADGRVHINGLNAMVSGR
ncbi:flagella basal body P-ring formation protein FlgA [Sandarakinorhabdus sp. DWP1-3-1]|uniref:flagella basal body P-ring formation protein FlgA n=1 Tax=Sandarakinorhabdus sp. DWP1-3-1 TaxID=2804627 RepID=UPI003CED0177